MSPAGEKRIAFRCLTPRTQFGLADEHESCQAHRFRAFRFPDPEYENFRQLIVFASKTAQPTLDLAARARLGAWSSADLPSLIGRTRRIATMTGVDPRKVLP